MYLVFCACGLDLRSLFCGHGVSSIIGKRFRGKRGRSRWAEELLQYDIHAAEHLGQEEVVAGFIDGALAAFVPSFGAWESEA